MKYRLIKEYPGGPKMPCEVKYIPSTLKFTRSATPSCYFVTKGSGHIPYDHYIENHPEFWEEIKPFEVVSVKYKGELYDMFDGTYFYDVKQRKVRGYTRRIDKKSLGENFIEIYQVKRTNDNEIFTVGDKIITMLCKGNSRYRNITKLLCINNKDVSIVCDEYDYSLENIRKAELLFTTADNVNK